MFIELDPAQARLKDVFFGWHVQLIPADQVQEFIKGKCNKLARMHDTREVVVSVVIGSRDEVSAGHRICKASDAEDVVWMELGDEEVGASVSHPVQLEEGSADHEALHVLIVDLHAARVGEVDEAFQGSVGESWSYFAA